MTTGRRRLLLLVLAVLVGAGGFAAWAGSAAEPMPAALAALQTDDLVIVETSTWLVFRPAAGVVQAGLVLYPGGRVDPRAYAPLARAIARAGYLVVVVPMPLNLAVFGADRAGEVMAAFPGVDRWAVGGHSLGGAMAARYAHRNPAAVGGLVLWAAYPAASDDLSAQPLAVASITGSRDGLATPEKIAASRALLPADTAWTSIEGGNHAQFGWYGPQAGDNSAAISPEEQLLSVVASTVALMARVAGTW